MNLDFKIKEAPAPESIYVHDHKNTWRNFMLNMKTGQWFELPEKYKDRVQAAAAAYLKGKYSLYKHPKKREVYVFLRLDK